MNAILVWILVGFPHYGDIAALPVPPMADQASCERVKGVMEGLSPRAYLRCVQVQVVK